jgi:hypothetical protein
LLLGLLIAGGIGACVCNSQTSAHAQFTMHQDLTAAARLINASDKPLMICNVGTMPGQALALIRLLRGDVPILLSSGAEIAPLPAGQSSAYVYNPNPIGAIKIGMEYNLDLSKTMRFFGTVTRRGAP